MRRQIYDKKFGLSDVVDRDSDKKINLIAIRGL